MNLKETLAFWDAAQDESSDFGSRLYGFVLLEGVSAKHLKINLTIQDNLLDGSSWQFMAEDLQSFPNNMLQQLQQNKENRS